MALPLTRKRADWIKNRRTTVRGNRLNYNVGDQQKYERELKRLVNYMSEETTKEVLKLFKSPIAAGFFKQQKKAALITSDNKSFAMDSTIGSQSRILINALMDKFTQLFDKKANGLAESMLERTLRYSKASLHSSLKQLSGGLSLKTGVVPEGMEDVVKATIEENVSLIRSIPEQYFKNITGSVMRSITTGQGLKDLVPDLAKYTGEVDRRTKNLALDQTRKAYNSVNKERMQSIGVKQFEWVHSGGGQHPRESHLKISGHIFDFATLYQEQERLGVPKADQGIPGQAINCFLGDTKVSLANGCLNLWRYRHVGDIVNISLHDGNIISSTLNHPILTLDGFKSANEIQESDYLIGCNANNLRIVDKKITRNETTFDNLFKSLNIRFINQPRLGSEFNFYGNIPENEVDAISVDNILPRNPTILDDKNIEQFIFANSNVVRDFIFTCFNPKIVNSGNPGIMRYGFSFIDAESLHSQFSCFAAIPEDNSIFLKNAINYLSTNFIKNRQRKDAFAIFISGTNIDDIVINAIFLTNDRQDIAKSIFQCFTDMSSTAFIDFTKLPESYSQFYTLNRVLKKSITVFDGHVYTMQSYNGWYSVSSTEIISKNCKCTMLPVIRFSDDE